MSSNIRRRMNQGMPLKGAEEEVVEEVVKEAPKKKKSKKKVEKKESSE